MQDFGNVGPKNWGDRPVFIAGGGPSLRPHQEKLRMLYQKGIVLAVNDSYKYTHFPDAIFSLDHLWLEKMLESGNMDSVPGPVFVAIDENNPQKEHKDVTYLHRPYRKPPYILSEDPTTITNGMNSGFGALGLAYLKGAKLLYLLGFDFKFQPDGRTHFHAGYDWFNEDTENSVSIKQMNINCQRLFPQWIEAFRDTLPQLKQAGVQVFNCSPDSALPYFPHKPYEECL